MSFPSDATVENAVNQFRKIIEAASNSNHAGEVAIVRAAAAPRLEEALRNVLPEIKNSVSCGDGRFTTSQILLIEAALAAARGQNFVPLGEVAA